MKLITVFTPTYNRAYCLHRVYDSLCVQSSDDFCWLVIDDGSTDDTREKVESWQREGKVEIQYCYKENGGMHTGHNKAYELIETEYNVCIDSDDYMPSNAIEIIKRDVSGLPDSFSGIIGLDADLNYNVIGTQIPKNLLKCKLNELYTKYNVKGDKKLVYRTAIVKRYPAYPVYEGEKFVPLDYKPLLIDQDYDLKPVNEILCIVEYQSDGSTMNILKQYRRHPNGFAFSRISRIEYGLTFKERLKNAMHLISSAIFAKKISWVLKSDKPFLVLLALPAGVILNMYIRFKTSTL